jgi:N-carbamoylputrescine amidase
MYEKDSMGLKNVKIGLVQMSCTPYPEENLKKAAIGIREAAGKGAQIVCLQELFKSEYFCQTKSQAPFRLAEKIPGPTTNALAELAKKYKVVLIGSLFEKDDKVFYNSAVIIDPSGKFLGLYRKKHIPDDLKNHYGEADYFTEGNLGYPIFETPYGRVGLQVCYDQWFPEGARSLAQAGAEIIFYPTAIGWAAGDHRPSSESEHDAWTTVQRGHAISNGVFVAACNRVGTEDHIQFWGSSFVADPMGKILAQASTDKEENLVVDCDLSRIEEVREDWPFLKECIPGGGGHEKS